MMHEKQRAITTIFWVGASVKASKERLVVSSVRITTGKGVKDWWADCVGKCQVQSKLRFLKHRVFKPHVCLPPGSFPDEANKTADSTANTRRVANARLQSKRPAHDVTLACNRTERIPMGAILWSDRQRKVTHGKSSTPCNTERLPWPSGTGIPRRGESGVMMSGGNWNTVPWLAGGCFYFLFSCDFVAVKGRNKAKAAHFDLVPHADGCSTCYRWQRQQWKCPSPICK